MATFTTQDGRRIPFLDWASAAWAASLENRGPGNMQDDCEGPELPRPPMIAANDLLDRNLLAFIQG